MSDDCQIKGCCGNPSDEEGRCKDHDVHYFGSCYVCEKDIQIFALTSRLESVEKDKAELALQLSKMRTPQSLDLGRVVEIIRNILASGKVAEGEGIWLGHSGQMALEEALSILGFPAQKEK